MLVSLPCNLCNPCTDRQGPLLKALSSFRYLAHAFAPILALVAAEQAARAGVHWADSPFFLGTHPPNGSWKYLVTLDTSGSRAGGPRGGGPSLPSC